MNRNILTIRQLLPKDLKCEFVSKDEFFDKISINKNHYLKIIFKNKNSSKWKNELMNKLFKTNRIASFNDNYLLITIFDKQQQKQNDLTYYEWINCTRQTINQYLKKLHLKRIKYKESSLSKIKSLTNQIDLMCQKNPCVIDYFLDFSNQNVWLIGSKDDIENFIKINEIFDNDRRYLVQKAFKRQFELLKNDNINYSASEETTGILIKQLINEEKENPNNSLSFLNQLIINNVSKRVKTFETENDNNYAIKKRKLS